MIKKTDLVKQHVSKGEWHSALQIASKFKVLSKQDKTDLTRAFECYSNDHFYIQLGFDPEALKKKGISTLIRLWG
ncbi:hypothetical protein [Histophilus somni]|uniref:hypothetical protein n=1 Tax=Histophilus somni TaxID=731 RepID=UPI00201F6F79|nr:hypothetical protein [Histophilus somni]